MVVAKTCIQLSYNDELYILICIQLSYNDELYILIYWELILQLSVPSAQGEDFHLSQSAV